jgi:hypothetical protein
MVWHVETKELKGDDGQGLGQFHLVAHSDEGGGFHVLSERDYDTAKAATYDPVARANEYLVTGWSLLLGHEAAMPLPVEWRSQTEFGGYPLRHVELGLEPTCVVIGSKGLIISVDFEIQPYDLIFIWCDGLVLCRQAGESWITEGLKEGFKFVEFSDL